MSSEVLPADLSADEGLAAVEARLPPRESTCWSTTRVSAIGDASSDVSVDDERRMLKVHCEAVLRLTLAALPGMRRAAGAR